MLNPIDAFAFQTGWLQALMTETAKELELIIDHLSRGRQNYKTDLAIRHLERALAKLYDGPREAQAEAQRQIDEYFESQRSDRADVIQLDEIRP